MAAQAVGAESNGELQASRLSRCLSPPEPEMQRGRRRARSPMHLSVGGGHQSPSRELSTLRGRCRYRSTSLLSGVASRNPSATAAAAAAALSSDRSTSRAPRQRQLLRVVHTPAAPAAAFLHHHHRRHRSQSPSRSRSADARDKTPHRRRQRTRSRGRLHRLEGSLGALDLTSPLSSPSSPLQFEVVVLVVDDQKSDTSRGNSGPE